MGPGFLFLLAGTTAVVVIQATPGCTWSEDTSLGQAKSWQGIAMSSDGTKRAAVVSSGKIWASTDSGATWTEDTSAGGNKQWRAASSPSSTRKYRGVLVPRMLLQNGSHTALKCVCCLSYSCSGSAASSNSGWMYFCWLFLSLCLCLCCCFFPLHRSGHGGGSIRRSRQAHFV